jgi:hypothetical protein
MSYKNYNNNPNYNKNNTYNNTHNNYNNINNNNRVTWKDNYDGQSDTTIDDNTNINIKSIVLDYLYNKIEVADHKYVLIKNIGDVYELKNRKYYVSGNTCGINSFLIFMKKDGNYYSYLVDRRSISYNRNTLKKSSVRFTEIKLAVDLKLYDGTIIDGVLIDNDNDKIISKGETKSNKMMFMISDVFSFCGKSLLAMNYKKKMFTIGTMLSEYIDKNKFNTSNIELFVSRPFEINQANDLFAEYINPYSKKYNIKGLTFYPENSGAKIIYLFDKQDDKYKNELVNRNVTINPNAKTDDNLQLLESSETKKIFKFELVDPECIDDIVINLEMKKTGISDVYKLYGIFHNLDKYIKKKIGIAYIPTYELSIKAKLFFLNSESKIINCKFNSYKGKWVPLDVSSIQKIDIINNEKRLKITEEEVIEQDMTMDE